MGRYQTAQAEGDKAHAQAATPEQAYYAYRKVHRETLARFDRAQGILAAGAVSTNGADGQYYVASQSGNGRRYLVRVGRVGAPLCNCPDFQRRGHRCKHILAAELHEDRQGQAVQRAQTYLDGLGGKLGRQAAYLDAREVLGKARRYVDLLADYYRDPRTVSQDEEFKALRLCFAVLGWSESMVRNLAGRRSDD